MGYIQGTSEWQPSDLQKDLDEGFVMIRKEFDELYEVLLRLLRRFR